MKLQLGFLVACVVGFAAGNRLHQLLVKESLSFRDYLLGYASDLGLPTTPTRDYPYFNFFPQHKASVLVGKSGSWSTPCFDSNRMTVNKNSDGNLDIKIVSSGLKLSADQEMCEDLYLILTTNAVEMFTAVRGVAKKPVASTEVTLTIPTDATSAEEWDLDTKGVRILRYPQGLAETIGNFLKTFELFVPDLTQGVQKFAAKANIDFLEKYAGFSYPARDTSLNKPPAASEVHSGDTFYIIRFDGLDPMLGWAMGSTTGHVTTALRINGTLYVVESTIDDSYWPTDNIQKTEYETWLKQAVDAGFLVVFAPLSEAARSKYNEAAAVQWFEQNEGFSYGFHTMLWGWLDTEKDNFPCLAPDFTNCLQWELLEPLLAYVDRKIPYIGDLMWNPGYQKRIDTAGLRTAEMFQAAYKAGYTKSSTVLSIVEQDTWLYNTTRYDEPAVGRAMVCCVFVCSMWKAAGVFGELADSINCAEQTNWDDYVLTIHADSYQQIIGEYTLELNNFHTKDPYAHMAETCPSLAPNYEKSPTC